MVRAVVVLLALVVVIVGVRIVRQFAKGQREIDGWLSGDFDRTSLGYHLTDWFAKRPQREEQRKLFVLTCRAFRCDDGMIAEHLTRCVLSAWAEERETFGDRLAKDLDKMFTFDPELAVSEEAMLHGKEEFQRSLDHLRALDRA